MSYIDSDDVVLRYDKRRIAEFLTDSDDSPVDPDSLSGNQSLTAIIQDACSEIDAAVTVGNRYTKASLATLAANADEGAFLRRIACDLVWGNLLIFKGLGDADVEAQAPRYKEAKRLLAELSNGSMVFGITANRDAGTAKVVIPDAITTNSPTYWNRLFGRFGNQRYC